MEEYINSRLEELKRNEQLLVANLNSYRGAIKELEKALEHINNINKTTI